MSGINVKYECKLYMSTINFKYACLCLAGWGYRSKSISSYYLVLFPYYYLSE